MNCAGQILSTLKSEVDLRHGTVPLTGLSGAIHGDGQFRSGNLSAPLYLRYLIVNGEGAGIEIRRPMIFWKYDEIECLRGLLGVVFPGLYLWKWYDT